MIPADIAQQFASVVSGIGGNGELDFSDIIEQNKGLYTPSRTKYGSRNEFEYTGRCPDLKLVEAQERLKEYFRRDDWQTHAVEGKALIGSPGSAKAAADAFNIVNVEQSC